MHIINVETLMLEEFPRRPQDDYAILSHTWKSVASDEVLYSDIKPNGLAGCPDKPGKHKVKGCCQQAKAEGFKYVWIDSCCIDKSNAVELGEAINSMYRWYRESSICYVYMEDVPNEDDVLEPGAAFSQSRWFTRGWTLQEMLAPVELHFYNTSWNIIAAKQDIIHELEAITGVPRQSLLDFDPNTTQATVAQRMSWASCRTTTRDEDRSYSLLGLFDVNLPMIYGEGGRNAFVRLQQAVMEKTRDNSIFAWGLTDGSTNKAKRRPLSMASTGSDVATDDLVSEGIWASSPSDFSRCGKVVARKPVGGTVFSFSSGRLQIDMTPVSLISPPIKRPDGTFLARSHTRYRGSNDTAATDGQNAASSTPKMYYGLLNCGPESESGSLNVVIGIPLCVATKDKDSNYAPKEYIRPIGYTPFYLNRPVLKEGESWPQESTSIRVEMEAGSRSTSRQVWYSLRYPRKSLALVESYPRSAWRGSTARMPDADDVDLLEQHKKKWYLARFRPVGGEKHELGLGSSEDILLVVCVRLDLDRTKLSVVGSLMTVSQKTLVEKIAGKLPYLRESIYHHKTVSVNGMGMAASVELDTETFTIAPMTTYSPSKTLNAEAEMVHADNNISLPDLFSLQDSLLGSSMRLKSAGEEHSNLLAIRMERLAKVESDLKRLEDERNELVAAITPLQESVAFATAKIDELEVQFRAVERKVEKYVADATANEPPIAQQNWLGELLLARHGVIESCSVCRTHYRSEEMATTDAGSAVHPFRHLYAEEDPIYSIQPVGQMALFCAVAHGRVHETQQLLRAGASADAPIQRQLRPLIMMAAFDGNRTLAGMLVHRGHAKVDVRDKATGETPLWVALKRGHHAAAQFLVDAGANVLAKNASGDTLMNWAAGAGSLSRVRFLIRNGGNALNEIGVQKAPLVAAAYNGNEDVIRTLLERITTTDKEKSDSIVQAALRAAVTSDHANAVRLLLTNKIDSLNIAPLLLEAVEKKSVPVLDALLDSKDVQGLDWQDPASAVAMMVACLENPPDCLAVLLRHNFPVDVVLPKNGPRPLTVAATYGRYEAVDMLLLGGAQVDLESPDELRTPLYMAIKGGHTRTVRVLLAHGADPTK
ncbi:hypothetical protein Sste5344_004346 [Sporothrix stenoceras]